MVAMLLSRTHRNLLTKTYAFVQNERTKKNITKTKTGIRGLKTAWHEVNFLEMVVGFLFSEGDSAMQIETFLCAVVIFNSISATVFIIKAWRAPVVRWSVNVEFQWISFSWICFQVCSSLSSLADFSTHLWWLKHTHTMHIFPSVNPITEIPTFS